MSLLDLDQAHHFHPFTDNDAMNRGGGSHIIVSAQGCHVTDHHGRRLLDGLAGLWCVNVGYRRREIIQAVTRQMETVAFYPSFFNSTTEPTIRLAARLAQLAPARLNHAVFSGSGSEANETALKSILAYWRIKGQPERRKFLTRNFAYHGVTLATTSMTGLPSCQTPFGLPLPGFLHAPAPHPYAETDPARRALSREDYAAWCLDETRALIEREGPETIAALIAEPVQGAGGVIVPPPGYLRALRALAREHGILFVADEVITGFGRLGSWFASSEDLWDLDPDLMILAKGLTSGYLPLGATMHSDEVIATLASGGYYAHGYTYSGHPTACAAALANLDIIESEALIPNVRDTLGPLFQRKLQEFASHPAVAEIRGFQLIGALELRLPTGAAPAPVNTLGVRASNLIREQGAIVRGIRDLIAISPPLVITPEELDQLFLSIRQGLDRLVA